MTKSKGILPPRSHTLAERMEYLSIPEPMSGCHLWLGTLHRGYGRLQWKGKQYKAYRMAWSVKHGPIPKGGHILHRCDNRGCVNAEHLKLGTNRQNVDDMMTKKRHLGRVMHGVKHPLAKLTDDLVRYIRASSERGVDLAEDLGVSATAICSARKGKSWKHVQ